MTTFKGTKGGEEVSATECRVCGTKFPVGHDCAAEFAALRAERDELGEKYVSLVASFSERCVKLTASELARAKAVGALERIRDVEDNECSMTNVAKRALAAQPPNAVAETLREVESKIEAFMYEDRERGGFFNLQTLAEALAKLRGLLGER